MRRTELRDRSFNQHARKTLLPAYGISAVSKLTSTHIRLLQCAP